MTNEQAHHYFFSAIETGEQIDVKEQEGHYIYLLAEKAIEKQITKKCDGLECPSCGSSKIHDDWDDLLQHCGDCGQKIALDWSVEE